MKKQNLGVNYRRNIIRSPVYKTVPGIHLLIPVPSLFIGWENSQSEVITGTTHLLANPL